MKKKGVKVLLTVFGFFALGFLLVVLYFYFSLSGNPLTMWTQQLAVLQVYETRYEEDFSVGYSNYSYKTKAYQFELIPEDHPELAFRTTLYDAKQDDDYAAARVVAWLQERVRRALDNENVSMSYELYIYELPIPSGRLESDLLKRLKINDYVVSLRWEVPAIDRVAIDVTIDAIGKRIEAELEEPLGGLTLRIAVHDAADTYYKEYRLFKGR